MGKYRFNKETLKFVEDKTGIKGWIKRIVVYLIVSILLALLYYFIISLVFSTDKERQLARENKMLEQEYSKMKEKLEVLDNTVSNLQMRDKEIYKELFNALPPDFSGGYEENMFFSQIDTSDNEKIIEFTAGRLSILEKESEAAENYLVQIKEHLLQMGDSTTRIPSRLPLRSFNVNQTGASIGKKINPFYKTVVEHNGIDLLANTGAEVIASADGTVASTVKTDKGTGNTIVINHGNGYVTKYMYLGDLLVRPGQKVKQGSIIARVGVTGMSFGPHLHYEVLKDGVNQDPVYYFFSEMSPRRFRELITISANTGQSLD